MIEPNEKFAMVCFRSNWVEQDVRDRLVFNDSLEFYRSAPAQLDDHWKEWLGTIRTAEVEEATVVLLSRRPAREITVSDDEDQQHQRAAQRFYTGLLVSGPVRSDRSPLLISGQHWGDEGIRVRHFSQLMPAQRVPGTPQMWIDTDRLRLAAKFTAVISRIEQCGEHSRVMRSLNSFISAIEISSAAERLHRFCRAIEGFLLPKSGHTKRQFKSRTELFIGPKHHDLMDLAYELRSAAEHLHDPYSMVVRPDEREGRQVFLTITMSAEAIARHCIVRVLGSAALLERFSSDGSIRDFWAMNQATRREIWGPPLDLVAFQQSIDWALVSDQALGLT